MHVQKTPFVIDYSAARRIDREPLVSTRRESLQKPKRRPRRYPGEVLFCLRYAHGDWIWKMSSPLMCGTNKNPLTEAIPLIPNRVE